MRPYKKPKYKLDVRKFDTYKVEKKEKNDFSIQELYREQLASKMRFRRR